MRILGCVFLLGAGLVLAAGCGGNRGNKAGGGTPAAETHTEASDRGTAGAGSNAEKIVGVWDVVKGEGAPPGAKVEFTRDGKVKMMAKLQGKEFNDEVGTYKVEGDKLTVTQKGGQAETDRIQTLNDTTLIVRDPAGKVEEYHRKK
jgi:uncharacterized protein (TIGR03066 family)